MIDPSIELDHRMHDRLRVDDDIDLLSGQIEEPMRFDDFQPLVHQRRRVDGDLAAHTPCRMLQCVLGLHVGERSGRHLSKWAARRGEDDPPDFLTPATVETLMNRAVLAVDGKDRSRRVREQRRSPAPRP